MTADTIKNVENWVKKMALKWNVDEAVVAARTELALRHKADIADLCGLNPETNEWNFEEYFRDLYPESDSQAVVYDVLERATDVAAKAKRDRDGMRSAHDQLRKTLGMEGVKLTH